MLPRIKPATLTTLAEPFDHPDWLFELKYDGFRAVACIHNGEAELVSRKNRVYKSFDRLCAELAGIDHEAVLDGEVVCLDDQGRPLFYDLLYRRGEPRYYVFDCMWLDGEDLREKPLVERKRIVKRLLPRRSQSLLYTKHLLRRRVDLFRLVCEQDLEGVVAN